MRMLSPNSAAWSWPQKNISTLRANDVFEDFDRLVDSFLQPVYASTLNFQPSCDINETKDHYLVSFDMPGIKKEDIKIEVKGNGLIISGERHREMKLESEDMALRHERAYGRFERLFTLPTTIAADKIEAHYENGVLNVMLPKFEEAKGRIVQVQTGSGSFINKILGLKKESHQELKDVKIS